MKKLIFVLFLFIGIAAHSQISQSIGSPGTATQVKGGLVIQSAYSDTASLNSATTLDNIPGVMVRTSDGTLWMRNNIANKWNFVAGNSSGSGTYINGANQTTVTINPFRFLSITQYNGPVIPTAQIQTEADSAWFRMSMVGNVPGKTGGYFITQSDSLNRLTSVGLSSTSDSTNGYQALFTKTGAYFGYRSGGVYNNAAATMSGVSVDATTKVTISGLSLLLPRLTTAQRTAISSPDEGLAVYDTTLHKLYVFDGTSWQAAW